MLLATLNSVAAIVRNWPWHSTSPSRWALASKWLAASTNGMPVSCGQRRSDAAAELGMRVDAACRRPCRRRAVRSTACMRPLARAATDSSNCRAKPPISWPEPQRRGVGQVRAADLDDLVPLLRPSRPARRANRCSAGIRSLLDRQGDGHVDRRGENVVGALPHVDVVVGMDRLVR